VTWAERLARLGARPTLLAVATMNAITGLAALLVLAPISFGLDAEAYRRGALAVAAGGYDQDFLYSPLAALLATPLTWVPEAAAAVVMAAIGLAVLSLGIVVETRGLRALDRLLVAVAVLGFIPVVNELLLGQTTLLVAATLWPVARWRDRTGHGIAFGIAMALAPKPALLPILVWMLVRRRRALLGTLLAALVTGLVGLLAAGVDAHLRWLEVLTRAGTLERHGNVSLWTGGLTPWSAALAVVVIAAAAWCVWRSEDGGLIAALVAGLLLAPYTLVYAVSILLLVVRSALRIAPWSTRLLALIANPALIAVPAAWLGACLLGLAVATRPAPPSPSASPAPR